MVLTVGWSNAGVESIGGPQVARIQGNIQAARLAVDLLSETECNRAGAVYALGCRRNPASLMATRRGRIASDMRPTVSIRREIVRKLVPHRNATDVSVRDKQNGHDKIPSVRGNHGRSRSVIEGNASTGSVGDIRG